METLNLNLLEDYVFTGGVISLISGFIILTVNTSPPFTLKDIIAVTLAWPFVIGILVTDYINGEF
jgi:hypothetical protein